MDRYDEKKQVNDAGDTPAREGDILGLSGAAVPKAPDDPSASDDPASVRQRRERIRSAEEAESREEHTHGGGAVGVDMGAGGEGTLLSGD